MTEMPLDPERLREQIRGKYREVAGAPEAGYHVHTGRAGAERCG
jgi:hypothetical protein